MVLKLGGKVAYGTFIERCLVRFGGESEGEGRGGEVGRDGLGREGEREGKTGEEKG